MGLLKFNDIQAWTHSMCLFIFIYVCYLTLETYTAEIPSISISQASLTARVNEVLQVECDIDKAYASSSAGFQWLHTNASGIVQLYDVSSSVPRVTVSEDSEDPTYSMLTIKNLNVEDSGQIRCSYYYPAPEVGSETVSYDAWLCVSDIPVTPPTCSNSFTNDNVILQCISTHMCPSDVTLEWRKLPTSDLYIGTSTRNASHVETDVLVPQRRDVVTDEEFICTFKSELYPDVSLNCTVSAYETPTTVPPNSRKAVTILTILPTTFEQIPVSFLRPYIIIIACAVGLGILLFIGCCVIVACHRNRKRSKDKPDNEGSYTELDITGIKDTTYTELKPRETTSVETGQRNVDDSTEDQGVYVNDWRINQIQKYKEKV